MPTVCLSYSRESEAIVRTLAEDIQALGHTVWFDQELSGGQAWWDQILIQVRDCDVFVFALAPEALNSTACSREYKYAANLGKPILPVLVAEGVSTNLIPPALSAIQRVDYRNRDAATALSLARAINSLPSPKPLPDPLPAPPEVPVSYLGGLAEKVDTASTLSREEQSTLLIDLKRSMGEAKNAQDARILLKRLRERPDLLANIRDEIDELLKPEVEELEIVKRSPKIQIPQREGGERESAAEHSRFSSSIDETELRLRLKVSRFHKLATTVSCTGLFLGSLAFLLGHLVYGLVMFMTSIQTFMVLRIFAGKCETRSIAAQVIGGDRPRSDLTVSWSETWGVVLASGGLAVGALLIGFGQRSLSFLAMGCGTASFVVMRWRASRFRRQESLVYSFEVGQSADIPNFVVNVSKIAILFLFLYPAALLGSLGFSTLGDIFLIPTVPQAQTITAENPTFVIGFLVVSTKNHDSVQLRIDEIRRVGEPLRVTDPISKSFPARTFGPGVYEATFDFDGIWRNALLGTATKFEVEFAPGAYSVLYSVGLSRKGQQVGTGGPYPLQIERIPDPNGSNDLSIR